MKAAGRFTSILFALMLFCGMVALADEPAAPGVLALWKEADLLYARGLYAQAETMYRDSMKLDSPEPGGLLPDHFAYWLDQHNQFARAMCMEHLGRWDEAVWLYLKVANNFQEGTHFPRASGADYRLVALYAAVGKLDVLVTITHQLDAEQTEVFRMLHCTSEEEFEKQRALGYPQLQYEPVRKLAAAWPAVHLPEDASAFLEKLPPIPAKLMLPSKPRKALDSDACYRIEISEHGFFKIPVEEALPYLQSQYNSHPTQANRSIYRHALHLSQEHAVPGGTAIAMQDCFLLVPLIKGDVVCFVCSKAMPIGGNPRIVHISEMKPLRRPDDVFGVNEYLCPCGEKIVLYDEGGLRPAPAGNAGQGARQFGPQESDHAQP